MKKADVVVGEEYLAKVSGTVQRVRVTLEITSKKGYDSFRHQTRWEAVNIRTGRTIVVKSAQRLRPIPKGSPTL